MLKNSARIQMVQEDMALCVNCMLCRLTEGSRMLLRWEAKQELVPMTFCSSGEGKYVNTKLSAFYLREK